jgi:hypothetical protein
MGTVFVGHDWAEAHHDVFVEDEEGHRLERVRLPEGIEGVARFHALVAAHVDAPADVVIATETERGLFVGALVAAGYRVLAVNPLSTSRYRERHSTSGAKSDPGDAWVLAELARTDHHNHRPIAGDSDLAEAVKVLARAHQSMVWARQRQLNQLRSTLREFYPAALEAFEELGSRDASAILAIAPSPAEGRTLEIQAALRSPQLEAPEAIANAMAAACRSLVSVIVEMTAQIDDLERQLADRFEQHPDAKIIRSQPGLGMTLGARVLGEFGDDPNRYADAKSRKNYAGTSPITKASGTRRVVLARYARNRRLADACYLWAFCALNTSPGARAYYDQRRAAGDTHHRALRALANRLVGILHGCLHHGIAYDEHTAWAHRAA